MKLLNKVALVTGAGTGIGKACSLTLLENGYQVVLVGRRMELLESVMSESSAPKTQSLACQADISDV